MITGQDLPTVFDSAITDQNVNRVQYSIIAAGTGAGKTTTYPGKLVKSGLKTIGKFYKVLVVLPTKEAVDNAYNRAVSNQLNYVNVNFTVGRARDGDVEYTNYKGSLISNNVTGYELPKDIKSEDTNLVFCTTGHIKNRLVEWFKYLSSEDYVSDRTINVFDRIIVDEAHLRNKNMDIEMILGMLKYLQVAYPRKGIPQVILTSATYNEPGVKRYTIEDVRPFTKTIKYLDIPGDTYFEKVNGMAENLYHSLLILLNGVNPGVILMFLPGIREIKKMKESIEIQDQMYKIFETVILHSKTPKAQRAEAFTPNTPGKWKIIFATNIAETSLTIPNVSLVIDFPYENVRVLGANQIVRTKIQLYAKDSGDQRAGRTGRTSNGMVLRLIGEQDYNNLPDSILPEIERLPIGNEMLRILDCNIDYHFIFKEGPKQNERIRKTLKELTKYRLVRQCGQHYSVTPRGNFVADLPLSNICGVIILRAIENNIDVYPAIVLACMIEATETLFQGHVPSEYQSDIPFYSILEPWNKFSTVFRNISLHANDLDRLMAFCEKNSINYDTFRETQKKIVSCVTIIRKKGIRVDINMFEPEDCFVKMEKVLTSIFDKYKAIKNEKNKTVYVRIENSNHKPLGLSSKFVKFTAPPDSIVSVLNLETKIEQQIMLWFPTVYYPSEDFRNGFRSKEVSRLEAFIDPDEDEGDEEEDEGEDEEEELDSPSMTDIV